MTTADTQDVVPPTDSINGEAGRLCVQRLVTRHFGNCTLINADWRDVASDLAYDVALTDPPYGIRFMGAAWDGADIEARHGALVKWRRSRDAGSAIRT